MPLKAATVSVVCIYIIIHFKPLTPWGRNDSCLSERKKGTYPQHSQLRYWWFHLHCFSRSSCRCLRPCRCTAHKTSPTMNMWRLRSMQPLHATKHMLQGGKVVLSIFFTHKKEVFLIGNKKNPTHMELFTWPVVWACLNCPLINYQW